MNLSNTTRSNTTTPVKPSARLRDTQKNAVEPDLYQRQMIDVLTPQLKEKVCEQAVTQAFIASGCVRENDRLDEADAAFYPMQRHPMFTASPQNGLYNHHAMLVKWRGRYWFAWDNCKQHEEFPGQQTLIAHSENAMDWSEPMVLAPGDEAAGIWRNVGGLMVHDDKLYAFVQTKWKTRRDVKRMIQSDTSDHDPHTTACRWDTLVSSDAQHWTCHGNTLDIWSMFEGPRLTHEGRLMCAVSTHQLKPAVLLWPGDDPLEEPVRIAIPYQGDPHGYFHGYDEGLFLYGEASWYTDDDHRIWLWHRDESRETLTLGVALSEDGGKTWTPVIRSNFPDSVSRVAAGRLNDGRFYLVGNSILQSMNRNFFSISLSDDGAKFSTMIQLIKKPTSQRFSGYLKAHGYQYPSCLVDGDKLLVGFSVNKEDMEIGVIDTTMI